MGIAHIQSQGLRCGSCHKIRGYLSSACQGKSEASSPCRPRSLHQALRPTGDKAQVTRQGAHACLQGCSTAGALPPRARQGKWPLTSHWNPGLIQRCDGQPDTAFKLWNEVLRNSFYPLISFFWGFLFLSFLSTSQKETSYPITLWMELFLLFLHSLPKSPWGINFLLNTRRLASAILVCYSKMVGRKLWGKFSKQGKRRLRPHQEHMKVHFRPLVISFNLTIK